MILRSSVLLQVCAGCLSLAAVSGNARAASESQSITLTRALQIPGVVLQPGSYTFSVEDRLQDRAIVRITRTNSGEHHLLLSVPNGNLPQGPQTRLILFQAKANSKQALRGWNCPGCSVGLEFVYPKAEAVKITDESAEPVLAVDPEYDKLPANLSPDDMKVVTLWLLSPKEITADNRGKGVKAAKYAPAVNRSPATSAQTAQTRSTHGNLPNTATNNLAWALLGMLFLLASAGLHLASKRRV